jgi:hypothetical protein
LEKTEDMPEAGAFAHLLDQVKALHEGAVTAGHHDLGPDLWLSADPAGQAVMTCAPSEHGFRLSLEAGDSGAWACLGMHLPIEALRAARYLGLLVVVSSEPLISFTPTLRYFLKDGGMQDVPVSLPVVLAGGQREHLSHIPLDSTRLDAASGCDLNLFFHSDQFTAEFLKFEPLQIL